MVAVHPLPTQAATRRLFTDLMGRPTGVNPRDKSQKPLSLATKPCIASVYQRDDASVAAVMLCDLAFATYTGAVLTSIPVGMADAAIDKGALDGMLLDNFREVANVAASLFNRAGIPHVKLTQVAVLPGGQLADAAKALALKPGARVEFDIEIPQYGSGCVALLV